VQEEVIPVYEEELTVGKRVIEQGRVRVHAYTVEQPVQKDLILRDERVEIEHRPISRTGDLRMPQEREIEVIERHEEPVVDKRVTANEEIVVRKEVDQHTETVRDTVRHTEVEIDDDRARATTPTGSPTTPPPRK
jgi:uncharacterized protein (TIGR02271 family)